MVINMNTKEAELLGSPSLVIEKYFDMVYRLARKIAGADKADDAAQNVFVRYMSHYREFQSEEHVRAWLIRVTYNCSMSELKNSWTEHTTALPDDDSSAALIAPDAAPVAADNTISRAVDMLPQKYRTVIHLYYYEEYSVRQIAEATGQRETTVRSHLTRGRQKLEKILKEAQLL